jgi:all-trans-retinol 13,14-reductase
MSSLTMAIILLRAGHKVKILEQHYIAGGYLHCFRRFGHQFDTGGHYVGAMEEGLPFHKLLKYLDVYDKNDYVELDRNAVDCYHFQDHNYTYVSGYEGNIENLSKKFPEDKSKILKYFDYLQKAAHSFPTYYFKSNYDQNEALTYLAITLNDVLDDFDIAGDLREILIAPCVLHGVSPADVAFGVHSILVDSLIVSSHGFREGGKKLASRLIDKIKSLGGEIEYRKKVCKVNVEDKQVSSVECDDQSKYEADFYVAGFHPKLLFRMVDSDQLKKSFQTRLNKIKESKPFIGAYLLLSENPGINPLSNYYFYDTDVDTVLESEKGDRGMIVFFTCPHREHKDGKFPLTVHASCSDELFDKWKREKNEKLGDDYESFKESVWKEIFARIEKTHPGFSGLIEKSCYSTPLTNKFYNPSENGSAYGIYHGQDCTGARALGPRTHFSNLFLTGQNTLFPGILGAGISGLRTSGHFVGLKGILRELEN